MEIKDSMWHAITRTLSVLAVIGVLLGPYFIGYQQGKAKGMANCMKERPTTAYDVKPGATLQVTNVQGDPKDRPIFVGLKIMRIGLGFIVDKK